MKKIERDDVTDVVRFVLNFVCASLSWRAPRHQCALIPKSFVPKMLFTPK